MLILYLNTINIPTILLKIVFFFVPKIFPMDKTNDFSLNFIITLRKTTIYLISAKKIQL